MAYFKPDDYVETMRLMFALQTVWLLTFCLVRLSVACSLLRFGTDRLWRWPLYLIMGLQITISSSYVVIQFAQCKPLSANWNQVSGAVCWKIDPLITYGWVVAGKSKFTFCRSAAYTVSRNLYRYGSRSISHAHPPDSDTASQHLREDPHRRVNVPWSSRYRDFMCEDDNIHRLW